MRIGESGDGAPIYFGFYMFGTTDVAKLPNSIVKRLYCHALLHQLPANGLDEAVEALIAMIDFYRDRKPMPQLAEPVYSIPATIVERLNAPIFPVTED